MIYAVEGLLPPTAADCIEHDHRGTQSFVAKAFRKTELDKLKK